MKHLGETSIGGLAAKRFVIEDIYPAVDGGRCPVKRVAGEPIEVWADVFRDGHDVLAVFNQCAGPCGTATMYSARGQDLGPFPVEASEAGALRFHDDLWIATHEMGFAIVDTSTGTVLLSVAPFLVGIQFLISALTLDIQATPD